MIRLRKILDEIEPYEAGKRASDLKRDLGVDELIKLSSNESPYPPIKLAQKAMGYAAANINRYPDGASRLLVEKLSKRLDKPTKNIIIGNGSNELIRLVAQSVTDPGDEIIYAWPSFVVYPLVAKMFEAKAVEVPLVDHRHDLKKMAASVTDKTKVIFVCNPNNPTGTIVKKDEIVEFMGAVPSDVLIVFDEAYYEFVDDSDYLSGADIFDDYPNVVVLRTFSKIYGMAGARIGYGIAPSEVVSSMHKLREPFNINMIAQVGAFFSLDGEGEIEKRKKKNIEEKKRIEDILDKSGIEFARSETNFIYTRLGKNNDEAFTRLRQLGIIVRAFGVGDYVRITVGSVSENNKVIEALERIAK